jgi:hypothetical protein
MATLQERRLGYHSRAGLEPGTSRFSTLRINHCATRGISSSPPTGRGHRTGARARAGHSSATLPPQNSTTDDFFSDGYDGFPASALLRAPCNGCNRYLLWQSCSAPPQPPAASPLPLPAGLAGRSRASARSGSGIRAGPRRDLPTARWPRQVGRDQGTFHRPPALPPGSRPYVFNLRRKQILGPLWG